MTTDGVFDNVEEVGTNHRLTTTDVDVEDLHGGDLVNEGHRLSRRELIRVAAARRGEAVGAGQVAGVGQFPRQADWCGQTAFEAIAE